MEVFHTLVRKVARAYYEPQYIVVLDLLSTDGVTSLKEEDIANKVKLGTKEIQKICGKLKDDRLIKSEPKQEPRRDGRMGTKQYYYIDYKLFVDTVKWKIHQMTKKISEKRENELQNKGYRCPKCERKISPLDAMRYIDPVTNLFVCDYCEEELIQENNEESENASQELYSRLMLQSGPILDLLKMTDKLVIPNYTSSTSGNTTVTEKINLSNQRDLRIAEDTEDIIGEVVVEFQNTDNASAREKQEEENKLKRKQNELPVWYQFSTVTGERVAPGPEENEPDKEEEEVEKKKNTLLIDEDLDDSYLDDFYDQLKLSSNDNIKLILTPISEYQDSDDSSTENEDFVEVNIKKNDEVDTNKRRIDSTDEMGSDLDDENGQRKKMKIEQMNTPTSLNDEDASSDYNDNEYDDQSE
ncbi:hypothetical protein BCR32DRAFT_294637 [Anaeromyces robustus]|uniref:HTH TFE/IIEalpha-type domain-containing protein n=1 Tax=Anaeromyces robustus TaxID=1754192 RepID=A0A1Y1X082_9FUNG|nr:hypothetical protein BCR32DRAFT_294637 [Anaeromyces robustus]|eukprot:ORX79102.1 hypothetical protein BCR32DRAFT_294637 [Anaeromyces robustus]